MNSLLKEKDKQITLLNEAVELFEPQKDQIPKIIQESSI